MKDLKELKPLWNLIKEEKIKLREFRKSCVKNPSVI